MSSHRVRFGFVRWDWKSQIDINDVNSILKVIDQPVIFDALDQESDECCVAIHTQPSTLTNSEWCALSDYLCYVDFNEFKISPAGNFHKVFEASESTLRAYIEKIVEKKQ
jgi:hypothetical protein